MILLLDIGNTHTHAGFSSRGRVSRRADFPTALWSGTPPPAPLASMIATTRVEGVAFCSVVPATTALAIRWANSQGLKAAQLTALNAPGLEIRYTNPERLGADRVAHALAAKNIYGAPVLAVSFGTAVTFDAVDHRGRFVGGAIAPGIEAWRDYLGTRTAQLPKINLRPVKRFIGRGTEEAIRVGCVQGFQGMVAALIRGARAELGGPAVPVVATGGYAQTIARRVPEITAVHPGLALDGLRIFWDEPAVG